MWTLLLNSMESDGVLNIPIDLGHWTELRKAAHRR